MLEVGYEMPLNSEGPVEREREIEIFPSSQAISVETGMTTLRVIARSTPPAYGLIAFASYLISTGSELKLDYVHSLEAKHLVELHHAGSVSLLHRLIRY